MIDKLKQIEDKLMLNLLSQPNLWNTLLVDYHPPMVERLWTQVGNYRISLHFIHACESKDALFHPHPWPSAIHVIHGSYEMGLGFGSGNEAPEKMCTILVPQGGIYYDMTHIDGWHYVRPVKSVCSTVMLTGEPWARESPKSDHPLKSLDLGRKLIMLEYFSNYYRSHYQNLRLIENKTIQKGDWVEFDTSLMSEYEKRGFEKFFNMRGFVIKRSETLIDARFDNDRIQTKAYYLKKLSFVDSQKPTDLSTKVDNKFSDIDDEDDDFDPDFL
jgi:hypothetical protein